MSVLNEIRSEHQDWQKLIFSWQLCDSKACTYQQLKENLLLIGGVLPFRQLW